LLYIQVHL